MRRLDGPRVPVGDVARRRRRKKRPVKPRVVLAIGLALLIAGFLFRRMMVPRAMHYLTHRPPDRSRTDIAPAPGAVASSSDTSGIGENLSPGDREALGRILRKNGK